ncbi:hypothetical protein CCUS01_00487 [Colletotrichum cuscutae]|uniref:Uncharacterized protein n=1 Tax=Colletotrichum cuscutae TaxID=1209917 RepID=A0AAI9VAH1_9PEZI|nr:hypothetical protein CCUS01_00487 [Colletotrichum cuscutae]
MISMNRRRRDQTCTLHRWLETLQKGPGFRCTLLQPEDFPGRWTSPASTDELKKKEAKEEAEHAKKKLTTVWTNGHPHRWIRPIPFIMTVDSFQLLAKRLLDLTLGPGSKLEIVSSNGTPEALFDGELIRPGRYESWTYRQHGSMYSHKSLSFPTTASNVLSNLEGEVLSTKHLCHVASSWRHVYSRRLFAKKTGSASNAAAILRHNTLRCRCGACLPASRDDRRNAGRKALPQLNLLTGQLAHTELFDRPRRTITNNGLIKVRDRKMNQARTTVDYLTPPTERVLIIRFEEYNGPKPEGLLLKSEGILIQDRKILRNDKSEGHPAGLRCYSNPTDWLSTLTYPSNGSKSSLFSRSCVYAYRRFRVTTNKLSDIAGNKVDYFPYERAPYGSGNLSGSFWAERKPSAATHAGLKTGLPETKQSI